MWLRFIADFRWRATRQLVMRFRVGGVHRVTRGCAAAALAAGAAVPVVNPKVRKGLP